MVFVRLTSSSTCRITGNLRDVGCERLKIWDEGVVGGGDVRKVELTDLDI